MAAAKAKEVSAQFEYEKETKNKTRFKESGKEPFMGYCYVDTEELKKLGSPKTIKVTIVPA